VNDDALDVARAAVVREHMESENRHELDTTIATFSHPRYELVATGEVFDGETEVRAIECGVDPAAEFALISPVLPGRPGGRPRRRYTVMAG
jgi:hypothetical protein